MWEREPALPIVIENRWRKSKPTGNLGAVRDALRDMMAELRSRSKQNFGHVSSEIEKLRGKLADLQLRDADRALMR